ncbi:TPR repeat-containing thioredoxin TTL1 [Forsythia ovata]|uniref:TPR repeat-containing thioredoxin TTL1 n=1 Tax=Forsythia ovata TaxID=205694 RepID=A0ABD1S9U2_9LAMI
MSHSGKPISELGLEELTDRLRLSFDEEDSGVNVNKPDFRELDLGSPVSPLRTRQTRPTTTTTSSSSSSSGSGSGRTSGGPNLSIPKKSDSHKSHSGELPGCSVESSPSAIRNFKPGHTRSYSVGTLPPIHSGGGSVNSPSVNVLPNGNICPSGRILKTGMGSRFSKTDVLGTGMGNYGHGSIMRGGLASKPGGTQDSGHLPNFSKGLIVGGESVKKMGMHLSSNDPEELKRKGNENYKKGHFAEALGFYDKAIAISPGNAAYHFNRAAALMGLRHLSEALRECEEAIRLDPGYVRAHHRLGSLLLSLGQVENARKHLCFPGHQPDPIELQKLQAVEKHLSKCADARRVGDWRSALREVDAAIASGADMSPQLFACRAEALLKLNQLDDAVLALSNIPKFEQSNISQSQLKNFGMLFEAYPFYVRAQIELAKGRSDNALTAIEKAGQIDPLNIEISVMLNNVKLVGRARARGNDLFKSERFTEACSAYAEGLRLDPLNSILYCNRAACWFKLGQWERSVDDCNVALRIQPNYIKALLRRAASNSKLERWAEAVRDYEVLRRELPDDNEVAESLFHAQVALKKSRGEDVYNMKFGGEVESISDLEQFRAAISSPGVSVVHFKAASNLQCQQISPFLDTLCARYPSVNFLKVDVDESPAIVHTENVRIVPTFKIYKKGSRVKEMVCPSSELVESSVRHYSV